MSSNTPPSGRTTRSTEKKRKRDFEASPNPETPSKTPKSSKKRANLTQVTNPFRNMPEGYGGVYNKADSEIPYVGTKGCRTCIGVYFEISDEEYFLAHFNTEIFRPGVDFSGQEEHESWRIDREGDSTEAIFRQIQDSVFSGIYVPLLYKAKDGNRLDYPTRRMRDTLVVVCPMFAVLGKRYVGDAMVQGVKSYMRYTKKVRNLEDRVVGSEGFVVKFPGGMPEYFDGELEGWTAIDYPKRTDKELDLSVSVTGKQVVRDGNGELGEREESDGDAESSNASLPDDELP